MEQQQKQHHSLKLLLSHLPPAQSPTSSSANIAAAAAGDPPAEEPAALDFNVVVILAAMLCALVCALGLHSMLQCVIRCTQRVVTDPVEWVAARRLNTGLKKEDVVAIPTSTYEAPPPTSSPASSSSAGCAICLADFSDGDKIRVIPICNHRFHVVCIDTWLMAHSSCPTCRHRLSNHSHHNSSSTHLQILTSL